MREPLAQLRADARLACGAVDGPDPEFAVVLLLDLHRDLTAALVTLDGQVARLIAIT